MISWVSLVSLGGSCSVFRGFRDWWFVGSLISLVSLGGVRCWRFVGGGFVVSWVLLVSVVRVRCLGWFVAGDSWACWSRWSRSVVHVGCLGGPWTVVSWPLVHGLVALGGLARWFVFGGFVAGGLVGFGRLLGLVGLGVS